MSYYVIIRGPAGAGKTTVARMVAKKIKARYISLDKLLHKHDLDRVEGLCIKEESFLKVNEEAIPLATGILQSSKNVVLDGNFYNRNQLEQLMNSIPFPGYIFTLRASPEDCVARDSGRKGRRRIGQKNIKQVHKLVSRFDFGTAVNASGRTAQEVSEEIVFRLGRSVRV